MDLKKTSYQKLPLSEQSCSAPHLKHFRWHTVISFISYPHLMHTYGIFLFFLILFWEVFNFFTNFQGLYDDHSVRQFPDLQDVSLILVVLRESIYLALLIYGLSVQQLLSYGKGWELLVLKYLGCFLN
jgi:hypothetical protein